MKKILIAPAIHKLLKQEQRFPDGSDLCVFLAPTADDARAIHWIKLRDLILTSQHLPGMTSSSFCRTVREDAVFGTAPIIPECATTEEAVYEATQFTGEEG